MEMMYSRLLSARVRTDISNMLCDYRHQLEPDALPIVIEIWDKWNGTLFVNVAEPECECRDCLVESIVGVLFGLNCVYASSASVIEISQWTISRPLPQLLSGPSPRFDMYRFFIYHTVLGLANR